MTENNEPSGIPDTPPAAPAQPTAPQQPAGQPYPYPYGSASYPGGYPPPPPQPYYPGYPGYTTPPAAPRNGLGIAALVIAVVGLISSFSIAGGIILGIVAVVLGFAARARVKRGEADNGGVALAGIILGFVAIIIGLAFIAIWVGLGKEVGAGDYIDCLQKAGQDKVKIQQCADEFKQSVENRFSVTLTPSP